MKTLKIFILAIILSLLFTFCVNKKSEKNSERAFTNIELTGNWNDVSTEESLNKKDSKIESIRLLEDSIAKIQFINPTGERILVGEWENGYEKKS